MLRTDNPINAILQLIGKPFFILIQAISLVAFVILKIISRIISSLANLPKPPKKQKAIKPKKIPQKSHVPISLTISISKGFLIFIGITSFIISFVYLAIVKDLPSPQQLKSNTPPQTTKVLDRNNHLLYKVYKNENRTLITLMDLPTHVIQATIAIEDQDFYEHTGISVKGLGRAIKRNLVDKKVQGGSTITQQLVKNTLLSPERTLTRKIKEAILAIGVELSFTKNQILTMYFNQVGYGGAVYGIEEASQHYFDKSTKDLSLAEAALLAGLPASPTTYSPFGANPDLAQARQHEVLRRMVEENYISLQEAEKAKSQKIKFAKPKNNIEAPHFVMLVKDLLVNKYGETVVHQGGLSVKTSLDISIQHTAEQIIREELQKIKQLNISNAAVVVTNPSTGEILAMVGSVDYFDIEHDGQVNVATRPRQPGSSIKPLTYALALKSTFSPSSTIDDTPITYHIAGSPPYSPINYDGRFHGRVTLRQALANSYNVPAVKLLSQLGINQFVEQGKAMGITTWNDPSRHGLSLTLGSNEVKMADMATLYGVFANNGYRVDIQPIDEIKDSKDQIIYQSPCLNQQESCPNHQVLSHKVAYQINDILSDPVARANTFGINSLLNITGHQVAVKTGTTNNLRDNWTIGYTNNILVAVWVGNNDNSPMRGVASGITGATPIWHRLMTYVLENQPPQAFSPPENLIKVTICPLTQTLSCAACPNPTVEYFVPGEEPKDACSPELITQKLNPPKDTFPRNQILEGSSTTQPTN